MASKEEPDINKQHIYIDTVYLIHYLIGNGEEVARARKQVKKAIQMTERNGDIYVKFPFIVAGELMNSICYNSMCSSDKARVIEDFFKLFRSPQIDFIPARMESFKLAAKIKDNDDRLDDTDILIASQALCDIHSTCLLTNDPKLLESRELGRAAEEIEGRIHELEVSETI